MPANENVMPFGNGEQPSDVGAKRRALRPRAGVLYNLIYRTDKGSNKDDITERLRSLFKPKTIAQASPYVYAQATYFPGLRKVYIPHTPIKKLLPGMEPQRKSSRARPRKLKPSDEDIERSLRRTKKIIRNYVWCNGFEIFATFTFNCKQCGQNCKNDPCVCDAKCFRFQPDYSKKRMSNWLKLQQKRKGKFQYLIVPEYHKDDKAIHFHALIKDYPGRTTPALNPKTGKNLYKKGRQVFSMPGYNLGLEEFYKIEDTTESHRKVGNYIRKYITKDMPIFSGRKRYWCSTGLAQPRVEDNPDDWYITETPENGHVSDYGIFLDFLDVKPEAAK